MKLFNLKRKKIIIETHFTGGLGNQFYIFSAAKLLEKKLNYEVRLKADISHYQRVKKSMKYRKIEIFDLMGKLNYKCDFTVLKIKPNFFYLPLKFADKFRKFKEIVQFILNCHIVQTNEDLFKILNGSISYKKIILYGYFQSNEIVEKSMLMENLIFRQNLIRNSIAIHVRLGDYLKSPFNKIYKIITANYIKQSFKLITALEKDLNISKVKIFSEDIDKAEKIVSEVLGEKVRIEVSKNKTAEEDIIEMSSYKNRILSNSTFSLLAHHLSKKGTSTIPEDWFKNKKTAKSLIYSNSKDNLFNTNKYELIK